VLLLYAGGGGYGDPKQRSREAVKDDLRHGYISAAAARSIYGVE
jgi:N-methylhydantoinase B